MVVLGGTTSITVAGAIYDPSTDIWKAIPATNPPTSYTGDRVVWTGKEIFFWGGINNTTGKRGGLYNPTTNTWRQPNTFNAPSERNNFTMVWTGKEVIVWGGFEGNTVTLNTGGRYNPETDTWTPTSTNGAADSRYGHTAVWTGTEMIVFGGDSRPIGGTGNMVNTGGRYNPETDSWVLTSTAGAPLKNNHTAVWTGSEMFVWGGRYISPGVFREAARYKPSTDSWIPTNNQDSAPGGEVGVWTGAELLVWGKKPPCSAGCNGTGGRYNPATNVWSPMSHTGAPGGDGVAYSSAVWTGKEMFLLGRRYNPLTDTWAQASTVGAPADKSVAVWTGKEVLVWGGGATPENNPAPAGGRYNPETDTWSPMATAGAPSARTMHSAVWTGSELLVWGGRGYFSDSGTNAGGRYNPETDTWRPMATAGAPEMRLWNSAVWTGSEMVIWGGMGSATDASRWLNTGARYNPVSDTWQPTSTEGAPQGRAYHRAVWTGSQMIVWGGLVPVTWTGSGDPVYTGARYNPATDVWTPTSLQSAASRRQSHVQVWTGTQMIVFGGTGPSGAAKLDGAVYNAPGSTTPGNLPPTVSLTSPAGGTGYQSGDTVRLAAEVSDADGTVTTVRFYANGQLVGADTQAPFAFDWTEVRGGDYALTATATDDGGAEARSSAANITVAPSTAPPGCVLTAPADGSTYAYGASVRMEATMTPNRDRSILRVEFLVDGQMFTFYEPPTYNPPYWALWTADASGTRSLTARCTDNKGGVTTSAPKVITVNEQGFSISGQLLESINVPITNVRLRLDGPAGTAPRYVITSVAGNGNYYFGGLKAGETYTVTPEAGAWRWSPDSMTFTAISKSWTLQHFYGTRSGYAISGRLTDAGGNPISPATVYMSGSRNASAAVGTDGTYIFYNLAPGGTYTVQPAKNLYTFAPNSRTFENLSAEQTADFTGTAQAKTYAVGGRVVDDQGAPVVGLTVRLGTVRVGSTQYRTTDADGRYSFDTVQEGETVSVSAQDSTGFYVFAPEGRTYYNIAADITDADFVANKRTFSIAGTLTGSNGMPLYPATVTVTGSATATVQVNSQGSYFINNLPRGGDYTIRPSKEHYDFTPAEKTYTALAEYMVADFKGTRRTNAISGRVTSGGGGLEGVTVTLSGTQTALAVTDAQGNYRIGVLAGGTYEVKPSLQGYTFTPVSQSFPNISADQTADFAAAALQTPAEPARFVIADVAPFEEGATSIVVTIRRSGDASQPASVDYETADGTARQGYDYMLARGTLRFAAGEAEKQVAVIIINDAHDEADETFTLTLTAPTGGMELNALASAQLVIRGAAEVSQSQNPADDVRFFVRQHYADFLNRVPDEAGLDYWARGIESCGADQQCREVKRIDTSAAFFLSIEFQETGFLVYRLQKATDAQMPRYAEFLRQAQEIGSGVVVGKPGWAEKMEANKREFVERWSQNDAFKARYSATTGEQYVDALITNTGVALPREFRDSLAASLAGGALTRGEVLRAVAEHESVRQAELNKAFVLMQYFGYLRRNPDDPPDTGMGGFNFWLKKLDSAGGDYRRAEMVRAFIDSIEYRRRFAP
ncbi:MAG TPA: carboxypeptidase regulatory-like domain-containing protein [Pyrinomonadaceae bacterium]|nr:carboxypeptidase regulatory-like domain-containing protein [Pyrinomonadaceae bacterium]